MKWVVKYWSKIKYIFYSVILYSTAYRDSCVCVCVCLKAAHEMLRFTMYIWIFMVNTHLMPPIVKISLPVWMIHGMRLAWIERRSKRLCVCIHLPEHVEYDDEKRKQQQAKNVSAQLELIRFVWCKHHVYSVHIAHDCVNHKIGCVIVRMWQCWGHIFVCRYTSTQV